MLLPRWYVRPILVVYSLQRQRCKSERKGWSVVLAEVESHHLHLLPIETEINLSESFVLSMGAP